ncbi:MAG: DUF3040 domain-containing protein [Nocardioides sp.]
MPLSEEELRLLEQMERALVEEDPKFASTLRGTTLRSAAKRRAIVAGACFVLGVAVMMVGAISELYAIAIGGFVIMLASATVGVAALRGRGAATEEVPPGTEPQGETPGFTLIQGGRTGRSRRPRQSSSGSFMERMEERWRRRKENGGY